MKIAARDIDRFVQNPAAGLCAALVYGPDEGLARERAQILGKTVTPDLSDPFNVVDLPAASVESDPARLADELAAMSMMGGRRLIRIRDGADKIADIIAEALKNCGATENFLLVEAGDLKPASKLRKLFEKLDNAAALPCYVDDAVGLARILATDFSAAGVTVERDALTLLAAYLTGDRALARGAVEKIITYAGPEKKTVTVADALLCCGDASQLFIDDLARAAAGGDAAAASEMLARIMGEGLPPVAVLRGLQNYFKRLSLVAALTADGTAMDAALRKLQPPLFFKAKDAFLAHLRLWPQEKILSVLAQLAETEAECKTTGAAAEMLADRAVLRVAVTAQQLRRRAA